MKLLSNVTIFVLVAFLNVFVKSYKILGVFPLTLKSHNIFCQSVMKVLAKRGHQVDVIASRALENTPPNYKVLYDTRKIAPNNTADVTIDTVFTKYSSDPIKYIADQFGNAVCEILANEEIRTIIKELKTKTKYDFMVTEAFATNCFMGLGHYLNIPVIILSAQTLYPWVEDAIGNPSSAAIYPVILSSLVEINSFWDRLQNVVEELVLKYKFYHYTEKIQTNIIRKYISADLPTVSELSKSPILTLSNTYFSFNGIRPFTSSLIEVGGLHILQDDNVLTPELQKWMDESEDGVVYFSMGTIILVESLPKKAIRAFYYIIRKLKSIRFLIRAKNVNIFPKILNNVKTLPWIPQIPVLRHKNTRVFISHCGLLSSMEALYFGVPVVGIPVAVDQFSNMHKLVQRNMGVKLNLNNITKSILRQVLTSLINNSTYRQAAKKASKLFKDRPSRPEETTIFWIEYVLRNGGILKSPAVNLHWAQNKLLDVYLFSIVLLILILYVSVKIIRIVVNLKNKDKTEKKKKKTN
ncbi:UDP-glucosyltransferase 2-like [Leptopilina heterotoma]|uniref:UDP-glucosyltransferase 2-like n=1 Tax=Leptopilina heterotoma TaxID=63436 RepID=UPI001CA887CA|nr:UDP-glucosyltransferase 2-like [Leptopilina heterotoma]